MCISFKCGRRCLGTMTYSLRRRSLSHLQYNQKNRALSSLHQLLRQKTYHDDYIPWALPHLLSSYRLLRHAKIGVASPDNTRHTPNLPQIIIAVALHFYFAMCLNLVFTCRSEWKRRELCRPTTIVHTLRRLQRTKREKAKRLSALE